MRSKLRTPFTRIIRITPQLEASLLVSEDIIDSAEMRRGQPSWHKKEDVGLSAVNDVLLFESCVYSILHKYFKDKPYYVDILNEFHQVRVQFDGGPSDVFAKCIT